MANDINYIMGNPVTKDHFIRRTFAFVIDLVILFIIAFVISLIVFAVMIGSAMDNAASGDYGSIVGGFVVGIIVLYLVILLIEIFYFVLMDAMFGGTLGKRILGLKVEALDGNMTLSKGFMRNISKTGAFLLCIFIPYLTVQYLLIFVILALDTYLGTGATNDPRMKFTDKLAGTTVVRTDVPENLDEMQYTPPAVPAAPGATAGEGVAEPGGSAVSLEEATVSGEEEKKEVPEEVKKYMELFEINEERAQNIYNAGYKKVDDLKDAIAEDLVMIDKINPTVARGIVNKMKDQSSSEEN